jgi:hypothetical protein
VENGNGADVRNMDMDTGSTASTVGPLLERSEEKGLGRRGCTQLYSSRAHARRPSSQYSVGNARSAKRLIHGRSTAVWNHRWLMVMDIGGQDAAGWRLAALRG